MKTMKQRRLDLKEEVYIYPHSVCANNCEYCFLKKSVIKMNWDSLFCHIHEYLTIRDKDHVRDIHILGGDLMDARLTANDEYVERLKELFSIITLHVEGTNIIVNYAINLETLNERGVELVQELHRLYPRVKLTSNCSGVRMTETYRKNYAELKSIIHRLGHIGSPSKSCSVKGFEDKNVDFEEMIMINEKCSYSYADDKSCVGITDEFTYVQCCNHNSMAITSDGLFTCGQITNKPKWISDEEWRRFSDDTDYMFNGYDQVIDWYGCSSCEFQDRCPGMCWISYYAQKELYNNRKCLYKDNFIKLKG